MSHPTTSGTRMRRRRSTAAKAAALAAAALALLAARFPRGVTADMVSSRLQIQIPAELFKPNGYDHQEALFGIPHYGGTISERVLYGGDFKEPWTLCTDADADNFKRPDVDQPFIVLVDRGDCTFVSKVRRAQHMGAAGVLIADNLCLCSDTQCTAEEEVCQTVEPIMADDGSGADITIPSFLMKKYDGDTIKSHMEAKQYVNVEMTWSLPAPDDRVEWTLWTSTMDAAARAFKREFREVVSELGQHAFFEPYYIMSNGELYGCTDDAAHCGNLCTNSGRYCMTDPDYEEDRGLSGADLVRETLRQKCVWVKYGGSDAPQKSRGIGEEWWKYVAAFEDQCGTEDKYTDERCIESAMKAAGVDPDLVNDCIRSSGGTEKNVRNTVLDGELNAKKEKSIVVTPTVYVNNVVERGGISVVSVMETICAGFEAGTSPKVCACAGQPTSEATLACVNTGSAFLPGTTINGVSVGNVLGIVIVVVLSMTAAGFLYWKRTQDHMRDQVRGILAEYMPLEDQDSGMGGGGNARVPLTSHVYPGAGQSNGGGGDGYAAPKMNNALV